MEAELFLGQSRRRNLRSSLISLETNFGYCYWLRRELRYEKVLAHVDVHLPLATTTKNKEEKGKKKNDAEGPWEYTNMIA